MEVVGNQRPRVAFGLGLIEYRTQPVDKGVAVSIVIENRAMLDAAGDDVMQRSGGVYAGLAGHAAVGISS